MRRIITALASLAVALTAVWIVSCTNNSKSPTAPVITPNGELAGNLSGTGTHYAHTFSTAGTFTYECTIHGACGTLHGVVVVVSPATGILNRITSITIDGGTAGGAYGGGSCSSLSNQSDSVHVGDQVTWTNNSPLPHNVTSY